MDNSQFRTQQLIHHGLGSVEDALKGLAHEALSAFLAADYDTAQRKFSEIMDSNARLTPSHLHMSLFLTECFLAMLQPDQALEALEPCWNRNSPLSITFSHPWWGKISKLFAEAKHLRQSLSDIQYDRECEQWTNVIEKIIKVQNERNRRFQMACKALPAIWSYWKSEALLRLGKLTEAQGEVVVALRVSDNPKVPSLTEEDRLWITGLMAYVKHDLEDAFKSLNAALLSNDKNVKIRKLYDCIQAERESDLQKLNHYEILRVPLGATDVEILAAYKSRALMIHPDRGNVRSHMEMSYLSAARDALLNHQERRKYDLSLALKSQGKR